jgi:hypothetical protein
MKKSFIVSVFCIAAMFPLLINAQIRKELSVGYSNSTFSGQLAHGFTSAIDIDICKTKFFYGLMLDQVYSGKISANAPDIENLRFENTYYGARLGYRVIDARKFSASLGVNAGLNHSIYANRGERGALYFIGENMIVNNRKTEKSTTFWALQPNLNIYYSISKNTGIKLGARYSVPLEGSAILSQEQATGVQGDLMFFARF